MSPETVDLVQRVRLGSEVAVRKDGHDLWSIGKVSVVRVTVELDSGITKQLEVKLYDQGEAVADYGSKGWQMLSHERAGLLTADEITERAERAS